MKTPYLVKTALYAGVRETRHFQGEYTLTAEDILAGRDFPDWCVPRHPRAHQHPQRQRQRTGTRAAAPRP